VVPAAAGFAGLFVNPAVAVVVVVVVVAWAKGDIVLAVADVADLQKKTGRLFDAVVVEVTVVVGAAAAVVAVEKKLEYSKQLGLILLQPCVPWTDAMASSCGMDPCCE
jgi:cytochrome bd-type quinol oxidase subunit 2